MTDINFRSIAGAAAIIAALAFSACGKTTVTNDIADAYSDTGADIAADTVQDVTVDLGGDVTGDSNGTDVVDVNKCIEKIKDQNLFKVIPTDNPMQIHPSAAFDGEAIWLAWSDLDTDTGRFEIRAARMACDGTLLVEPFSVDLINPGNSYEAEIAISKGNMLIAWHLDNSMYDPEDSNARVNAPVTTDVIDDTAVSTDATADTGSDTTIATDVATDADAADPIVDIVQPPNDNMQVYYRTFKIDGTPIMTEALRYMPEQDGAKARVNNWVPKVAGLPDGKFAITSAWAWPEGNVFQAVLQRFNSDGTVAGSLIHPNPVATVGQMYPNIAVDAAGNIHMVWSQTDADNADITWIASVTIPSDGEVPLENSPVLYETSGDGPSVATNSSGVITAYNDQTASSDIVIVAETANRALKATTTIGDDGYHASPIVVADSNGLVVAWYKIREGWNCDMMIKKLAWNGGDSITSFGDPGTVNAPDEVSNHAALSAYQPVLVSLGEGNYFVSWSERQSSTFAEAKTDGYRIYGRFMKL
jgi:hypothetical protein